MLIVNNLQFTVWLSSGDRKQIRLAEFESSYSLQRLVSWQRCLSAT
jgi:hypothetical protein